MTMTGSAELERAVGAAVQRVRDAGERVVVSCSLDVPLVEDALTLTGQWQSAGHGFFWERPADRLVIAAGGATAIVCAEGPSRFEAVSAQCRAWRERIVSVGEAPGQPLFVGGFAFAEHGTGQGAWAGVPAARMILPRWVLVQEGARATLTVNVSVERALVGAELAREVERTVTAFDRGCGADEPEAMPSGRPCYEIEALPSVARWQDATVQTIADIRSGRLQKLVLARACRVRSSVPFNCARVVRRLRRTHPACTTFWIHSPECDFVGATPELLVRQAGEAVWTQAIAGSCARGDSAAEDRALGDALMGSAKERVEHELVVRALAEALAPLCRSLDVGGAPQILPLEHVQHLVTRLCGRLAGTRGVLDVVARLHPTPAVGGFPRAAALASLGEREQMDRGWYAGPIGWTRGAADGEFAVALRCALVRGVEAVLYAGAGIVAQSEPHAELAETRLKFQALLSALTEC